MEFETASSNLPLTRDFENISILRQVIHDGWVLFRLIEDAFKVQVLILWDVKDLDIVAFDAERLVSC